MLTRDAILKIKDIKTEELFVPEWGDTVLVRGLTGNQRDRYEASIVEMRGKTQVLRMEQMRARLCALCLVDANGRPLFDFEEAEELGKKNAAALERICQVAQRLSGLTDGDVEALAKN